MKIIKNNYENKNNSFPVRIKCKHCGSELELEEDDCRIGTFGAYYYTCQCCGEEVMLDEPSGIVLTTENIEFPTHFYHFAYEDTYPTPEEIKRVITEMITYLRDNKEEEIISKAGRSLFVVEKFQEDKIYAVSVAPNYYATEIPFAPEDY